MSETQIADLKQRVSAVRNLELPQLHDAASDPHSRLYVMALDGTQNDAINDPEHITNVGRIAATIPDGHHSPVKGDYTEGVGSQPFVAGVVDSAFGLSVEKQATDAYNKFVDQVNAWRLQDKDAKISLAGIGFSRGCTALLVAANMVHEKGVPDFSRPELETHSDPRTGAVHQRVIHPHYLITPSEVKQALILNDQVATGKSETLNRSVPPSVVSVIQLKAEHEYREPFPFYDTRDPLHPDPRIVTIPFPGAHSDIGGGYKLNGISSNTLLVNQIILNKFGAGLPETAPETDPAKYVIHDSEYLWNDRHLDSPTPALATRPERKEIDPPAKASHPIPEKTSLQDHMRDIFNEWSPEQQAIFLSRMQENLQAQQLLQTGVER